MGKERGKEFSKDLINVYLLILRITNKNLSYFTIIFCFMEFYFCDQDAV